MHSILDYIFYLNGTVYKMRIQSGQKKKTNHCIFHETLSLTLIIQLIV